MAKMADGKAITYPVTVLDERCEVTVYQSSKTVFVAHGTYKGKAFEGTGGTRQGALGRWRHLAERSED
ncbi:hypothetical protein [Sphingobium chungangianum]